MSEGKPKGVFVTMVLKRMPRQVRTYFKSWCELHEITMREKIISLMKETVKNSGLTKQDSK